MWKYVGVGVEGVIGVPARDLTDEEFTRYAGKIHNQFPDQPDSLRNCGLYEYMADVPIKDTEDKTMKFDAQASLLDNDTSNTSEDADKVEEK